MKLVLSILTLFILASCSSITRQEVLQNLNSKDQISIKLNLDFYKQDVEQCGPTSLYTILSRMDKNVEFEKIKSMTYTPASEGSHKGDMLAAIRRLGFTPYKVSLSEGIELLVRGMPTLVFQNLGLSWLPQWHYSVLVGYESVDEKAYLHDGETAYAEMTLKKLANTWSRGGEWSYVITSPKDIPEYAEYEESYQNAIILLSIGKSIEGIDLLHAMTLKWPHRFEHYSKLAEVYYGKKKYKESLYYIEKAIKKNPKSKALDSNKEAIQKML